MRSSGIHGWIGGRYGSPTEYGLPMDDSYLHEGQEEEEEPDPEPQPCACAGAEWIGCACQAAAADLVEEDFEIEAAGDDWTPVRIGPHDYENFSPPGIPPGLAGSLQGHGRGHTAAP